jgi:hypothetical protein
MICIRWSGSIRNTVSYNILITIYHNHTERHIMEPHYMVTLIYNPYFIYKEVILPIITATEQDAQPKPQAARTI